MWIDWDIARHSPYQHVLGCPFCGCWHDAGARPKYSPGSEARCLGRAELGGLRKPDKSQHPPKITPKKISRKNRYTSYIHHFGFADFLRGLCHLLISVFCVVGNLDGLTGSFAGGMALQAMKSDSPSYIAGLMQRLAEMPKVREQAAKMKVSWVNFDAQKLCFYRFWSVFCVNIQRQKSSPTQKKRSEKHIPLNIST